MCGQTKMFAVLIISICAQLCKSVPIINVATSENAPPEYMYIYSNRLPDQRIFWNSIGDFIMGTDFFPIEVNVPDIINNIAGSASGVVGGALQRIPIVNRFSSAVQPRPKQYYLLMPLQQDRLVVFNSFSNNIPVYPYKSNSFFVKAMAWANSEENSSTRGYNLRKSISTIGFSKDSSNLNLREARSFTGSLEELKNFAKSQCCYHQHEHNINCPDRTCDLQDKNACVENGYITKEVSSDQVFLVKDEMLTYRGKRYSLNDIAMRWKKDCRMWLWKNKMNRKNRSVGELREKIQNLKLFNRPSLL